METEYRMNTDYKGFIKDWRERYLETIKDQRKNGKWVAVDVTVPDEWSETAEYRVKMFKFGLYMIVKDKGEEYRYRLHREILSVLYKHESDDKDEEKEG